jgi:hypothetical protein
MYEIKYWSVFQSFLDPSDAGENRGMRLYIGYTWTSRKPMIQLGGTHCTPTKLVKLIKIWLDNAYSNVWYILN